MSLITVYASHTVKTPTLVIIDRFRHSDTAICAHAPGWLFGFRCFYENGENPGTVL